ncbi:hypothetical protein HOY80DRAFT_965145 [Tuber brumale]|nr:hypothetical protein HOY80DRAFT_965145 [Tuber brumale]
MSRPIGAKSLVDFADIKTNSRSTTLGVFTLYKPDFQDSRDHFCIALIVKNLWGKLDTNFTCQVASLLGRIMSKGLLWIPTFVMGLSPPLFFIDGDRQRRRREARQQPPWRHGGRQTYWFTAIIDFFSSFLLFFLSRWG